MVWEQGHGWPEMRKARERRGMSVRELARRCGKSAAYIYDIEKGARFGAPTLRCVTGELGLTAVELDLHHYRFRRIADDLIFGDEGHVRRCLQAFREALVS